MVRFTTAPGTSRQMQTKAVCEEWGSGRTGGEGGRFCSAFTQDQMMPHLDDYRSAAEQWGAVFRKQHPERPPKTLRFDGSNHHGGGESLVVVSTPLFFTTSTLVTCWRRFADVPAGSDVADFRCPMCTSAERYFPHITSFSVVAKSQKRWLPAAQLWQTFTAVISWVL